MIRCIENHIAHPDRRLVETMFADRKALFVDLFGWDIPVIDGRFEMDSYDGPETVYLVVVGEDGDHLASMRLIPSEQPHMLSEVFSHLCPAGVPVGPRIWESSRLCLPQRHGAEGRRALRNALISAMVDFALDRGIDSYTGVLPAKFRNEVVTMGWLAEPLGPATPDASGSIGAFAAHIHRDTPARLRWTGTYVGTGMSVVTPVAGAVA